MEAVRKVLLVMCHWGLFRVALALLLFLTPTAGVDLWRVILGFTPVAAELASNDDSDETSEDEDSGTDSGADSDEEANEGSEMDPNG